MFLLDYHRPILERRLQLIQETANNEVAQKIELERCRRDVVYWVNHWGMTYDPKSAADRDKVSAYVPFMLFERQVELLHWLEDRTDAQEEGVLAKSRDIGATWLMGVFAVHRWRFFPGWKTTFGSRKLELVDKLDDPDAILPKIRIFLYNLPTWMLPPGYDRRFHDNYCRIVNPDNNNTITGEGGDQMGRGGRSTLYVVDEGAHIEHAEMVEAAIVGNADCRVWVSSVKGPGNLFARKYMTVAPRQRFRFHYSSDPRKDDTWKEKKIKELGSTPHLWAAEYEIDFSASIEGVCIPAKWVAAAVELHKMLALEHQPKLRSLGVGGLDIGGGKARSVFVARFGPLVENPVDWGDPDTIDTAYRGLREADESGVGELRFDSVGIGESVRATLSRQDNLSLVVTPTNVGVPPSDKEWPDGTTSKDLFRNLKAEGWWIAREKFQNSYEHLLFLKKEGGREHSADDFILIPPEATHLIAELSLPKVFRTENGKMQMESKQQLASRNISSPDFAEALILTFCQVEIDAWALLAAKAARQRAESAARAQALQG